MPLQSSFAKSALSLEQQLGQKLILDFRYYCEQGSSKQCRTPMTSLPSELANVITEHNIGGVILFSENTQSIEQTITLNTQLQTAASKSSSKLPLFISIDQEGGRVARLPRDVATSFTGNMSIGATYKKHGIEYATKTATVIAKELASLGVNVNYAPTVDVNMNPDNPVINVRSFGENPTLVGKLGAAQVAGFESNGVITSLKHFPGHGDTSVDSHTGLPQVNHSKEVIYEQDLAPFKHIIAKQNPGMIMTAHIQYPQLDSSTFVSVDGKTMIKPATMSRTIITDILRDELNYQGVVVTDALDMAGISHFFTPTQAVINTFAAGVDIALMPIEIRTPDDLNKLGELIKELVAAVKSKQLDEHEIAQSAKRITALKSKFRLSTNFDPITALINAKQIIGSTAHRAIEAELAVEAITQVKNTDSALPLKLKNAQRVHIIMPDTRKCMAMQQAIETISEQVFTYTCSSLQGFNPEQAGRQIKSADVVIAANATPNQSAVEIGGMDDLKDDPNFAPSTAQQPQALESLLKMAKQSNKSTVFISLRAPYDIATYGEYAQAVLASYAYNIDIDEDERVSGPAFTALAKVLLGKEQANGVLPVTIKPQKAH
ncbi:glycoside hydrolase family 3 N-terminal domain-containing protein [Pseudoalteromonas carrageenovora]|uniref:glycoside hydrolase family 3 protein n=1 Tax=Pseudoalteromonas carrageenovora TaxID=227 RepID=UPI0026E1F53C|nr:glycoside hydrolase family 3 protein [Pseudoalteromonas carrageenovora]MDO6634874.1 glycoside hydrolase family 3 N-terminal domain-containing protein [Pseudoalteromonas carrageenovora]MDO6649555.1 glycoside hydrolase family 3 N-terminal domain-containing protein [Pseudoalteromonas carrageenovora]